jgi:hypothetical protein
MEGDSQNAKGENPALMQPSDKRINRADDWPSHEDAPGNNSVRDNRS